MYALVLPDLGDAAVDRPYSYLVPPHLQARVVVGGRVLVPLGTRQVAGFVLALEDVPPPDVEHLRALLAVISALPAFTPEQAALARWMAETTLAPLSEALRPCLADAGVLGAQRRWQCTDGLAVTTLLPDPARGRVLDYLRAHPGAATAQLQHACGPGTAGALETLRHDGLIRPLARVAKKARDIRAVFRALPGDVLLQQADALPARAAKQAQLLRWASAALADDPADAPGDPLTVPEVARRAGVGEATVRTSVEKGWLRTSTVTLRRNPWEAVAGRKATPPPLTAPQRAAVDAITAAVRARAPQGFLLFGVTGSGKTEVFLHAIEAVLAAGRQAIVLVPEISLTAQAMALYHGRFPHQVAVLHSHLSAGERYDEWQRIAAGEARVVLGARSAIFAPCPDVGLIVVDEEHESSYKQESSPRYHARAVARQRGSLSGAPVVLASATPSLESMREAELGTLTLLCLPERIEARPMPTVKLVDLRHMTTNARILSHPLRAAIGERLTRHEQTILFLNRRGYAYVLLCTACGHQEECPSCALPLTLHRQEGMLRCHHCDFQRRAQPACAKCQGQQIAYKGVGTERLEAEVRALWPEARVARLDRDSTARKGAHQEILDTFGREETDILIGTQMVAKGFDFPRVTLVGVIAADTSLALTDFRAPERTFQLLTQVAGRAGRSEWPGEVLVQTFQPDHVAIRAAVQHDYERFYVREIRARGDSAACWPPLTALINIIVSGADEAEVRATAAALARRAREEATSSVTLPPLARAQVLPGLLDFLAEEPEPAEDEDPFGAEALLQRDVPAGIHVDGPAPCPLPRLRGRFRYHLLLRGQDPAALRQLTRALLALTPPRGVHVVVDVDPLTLA